MHNREYDLLSRNRSNKDMHCLHLERLQEGAAIAGRDCRRMEKYLLKWQFVLTEDWLSKEKTSMPSVPPTKRETLATKVRIQCWSSSSMTTVLKDSATYQTKRWDSICGHLQSQCLIVRIRKEKTSGEMMPGDTALKKLSIRMLLSLSCWVWEGLHYDQEYKGLPMACKSR